MRNGSYTLRVVLQGGVKSRLEPLIRAMANFNKEVIGLHDFRCYPACRFVESDTSVICHMLVFCFGSFILQDIFFKSSSICFGETKYDVY